MKASIHDSVSVYSDEEKRSARIIFLYTLFLSAAFFAAVPFAMLYTNDTPLFEGLLRIATSTSRLVTDYFALAGLAATFLNAAICGFACNIIIFVCRVKSNATTFAAYMLVVAHCFYGLNFLNMWPTILGVLVFCLVTHRNFGENLHIALFSTALGPFVSDFLYNYTFHEIFFENPADSTAVGILLALVFGVLAGFIVPALIPGTTSMHRGFNMYKAGLAIGLLGIFVYSLMYKTIGVAEPADIEIFNTEYYARPYAYRGFMNIFFATIFAFTLILGFFLNGKSFRGYCGILRSTGCGRDFLDRFGAPLCLLNVGIYGLCILAYLNVVFVLPSVFSSLPQGVGFTGATVGVVLAALTFSLDGQQPKNVLPIVLGYMCLHAAVSLFCGFGGINIPWSLSSQAYINGLAFATGLCPFAGKYGLRVGMIAGVLSAIICTSTAEMHGGFVLYNGGFTAGLTALVLLPMLDFYKAKVRLSDDE